jgi:hypothetical protein
MAAQKLVSRPCVGGGQEVQRLPGRGTTVPGRLPAALLLACLAAGGGATGADLSQPGGLPAAPPPPLGLRRWWCSGQDRGTGIARLRGGASKLRAMRSDDNFGAGDQLMINKYAGLNFRRQELLETLKEAEEEAEGLRSAADEILMAGLDGPEDFQEQRRLPPGIDFRWGETFSEWSPERAQEELDYRVEMNQLSQDDLNQEIAEIEEQMASIKERLKAKFGDQVHLEDEEDEDENVSSAESGSSASR